VTQGHHRTFVGIGFIAAAALVAVLLALKPTVARGAALAKIVFEERAGVRYECDDNVPIAGDVTVFRCRAFEDGMRTTYEVRMDRAGAFDAHVVDTSLPGL